MTARPNVALTSPTVRKAASGVVVTATTARLAAPGNAANSNPSMNEHKPERGEKI